YVVAVYAKAAQPQTFAESLRIGSAALQLLGIALPLADQRRAAARELDRCRALLAERPPLADPPTGAVASELDEARLAILLSLTSTAWYVDVDLFKIIASAAMRLVLTIGHNKQAATIYALAAVVFAIDQQYDEAFELARRAQL